MFNEVPMNEGEVLHKLKNICFGKDDIGGFINSVHANGRKVHCQRLSLSQRWEHFMPDGGDAEGKCNLVYLTTKDKYLFLSKAAIDTREHEIVLSEEQWPSKLQYPRDIIENAILNHIWKRLA